MSGYRKPSRAQTDVDTVANLLRKAEAEATTVDTPPPETPEPKPQPTSVEPIYDPGKTDGRTLRKKGREAFATRIKPETHEALRRLAYEGQKSIGEIIEIAIANFPRDKLHDR